MNSRTLTLARLVQLRACGAAQMVFRRIFGESVEVTPERFSQPDVVEANFDYDWGVDLLIDSDKRSEFYAERRKRIEALKAEHNVVRAYDLPPEARQRAEAILWAEFYVAHGLDEARPTPIAPCETVESLDEDELEVEEPEDDFEEDDGDEDEEGDEPEEVSNGN